MSSFPRRWESKSKNSTNFCLKINLLNLKWILAYTRMTKLHFCRIPKGEQNICQNAASCRRTHAAPVVMVSGQPKIITYQQIAQNTHSYTTTFIIQPTMPEYPPQFAYFPRHTAQTMPFPLFYQSNTHQKYGQHYTKYLISLPF